MTREQKIGGREQVAGEQQLMDKMIEQRAGGKIEQGAGDSQRKEQVVGEKCGQVVERKERQVADESRGLMNAVQLEQQVDSQTQYPMLPARYAVGPLTFDMVSFFAIYTQLHWQKPQLRLLNCLGFSAVSASPLQRLNPEKKNQTGFEIKFENAIKCINKQQQQ